MAAHLGSVEIMSEMNSEFSMPMLSELQIERRQWLHRRVTWALYVLLSAGSGVGYLVSWFKGDDHSWPNAIGIVLAFILTELVIILAVSSTRDEGDNDWLPQSSCAWLARLCDANAGLQPYRDRIRQSGRRFTREEAYRMHRWVQEQSYRADEAERAAKDEKACRQLYGIAGNAGSTEGASA
jgi:hypothetical protein